MDKDYLVHVREIKRRVIFCALCFLAVLCICIVNAEVFVRYALKFGFDAGFEIISVSPGDAVIAIVSLILKCAVFFSVSFIVHQGMEFVLPAVSECNKFRARMAFTFIVALFYAGAAFSFCIILPFFFKFMAVYGESFAISRVFSVSEYLGFIFSFSVCMGIAFETPVLVSTLWGIGLVDRRRIKKFRSVFYLLIFVAAAVITPPDVISQLMVALPMLVLFEVGNIGGMYFSRKKSVTLRV